MKPSEFIKPVAFVVAGILFWGCNNIYHDLLPPEDSSIYYFGVENPDDGFFDAAEDIDDKDDIIEITIPHGVSVDSLLPVIKTEEKATVIPIAPEYLKRAFAGETEDDLAKVLALTGNTGELGSKILELINRNKDFEAPGLDIPIDFTGEVLFCVIAAQKNLSFYRVHILNQIFIVFDYNGGKSGDGKDSVSLTGNRGAELKIPESPERPGYRFSGWSPEIPRVIPDQDTRYQARWILESDYIITYKLNGGTNAPENPASYNVETETITLKDPVKPGYTFAGWYMAEDFTGGAVTKITQGSTGNITLYAKWELESYTITYELDGGTNAPENPAGYNVETGTITLKDPAKAGYTFEGWYKDGEFTTQVTEITQGTTGNITLYAKWLENYTITYELNGGTNASENPASYNVETETITLRDPVKPGYTFGGWYMAEDFTGDAVTEIAQGSTGDITLYAKWEQIPFTTVMVEGGNCTLNSTEITLSSFWISPYEVTQEEFESLMAGNTNGINANPSGFTSNPAKGEVQKRRPVECVSWYDAIVYCNLLSIKEGLTPCYTIKSSTDPAAWGTSPTSTGAEDYDDWKSVTCNFDADGYRLPTEAEWEYAARGGQTGITDGSWEYEYSGSNTADDVAWHCDNSDRKTHEVGKKQANALGLYDMSGNEWEWCWDRYGDYPSGTEDPAGPDTGLSRVRRGGSWSYHASYGAVSHRYSGNPYSRNYYDGNGYYVGIRLVRSAR